MSDSSPPAAELAVTYRSPDGRDLSLVHATGDSAASLTADATVPVTLRYTAIDSSGLRALSPSLLIQHTVGVGIERQFVGIDPVKASCPQRVLSHEEVVYGTGERRTLVITLSAENWTGTRAVIEPVTVQLR